jgi:hypothetical protein
MGKLKNWNSYFILFFYIYINYNININLLKCH